MISSEANEIAEKDAKKTIACEHITKALEELGFAEYVPDLLEVAQHFKTQQVVSRGTNSIGRGTEADPDRRVRRNRARSSRVDCQRQSYYGSRKSFSGQLRRSSTPVQQSSVLGIQSKRQQT